MNRLLGLILIGATAFGQNAFETDSWYFEKSDESSTPKLEWSGFLEFEPRYFTSDMATSDHEVVQILVLGAEIEHGHSSFNASFKLNSETQSMSIDELFFTSTFGRLEFDGGLHLLVWGKGDQLHIVDNINADNYSDFIFPDYLERRIGENMMRMNVVVGPYSWNSQFEIVVTPGFTKMKFPDSGPWAPKYLTILSTVSPTLVARNIQIVESNYPELKHGQTALRWTQSHSGFDYGFSYYHGKSRIPAFQMSEFDSLGFPHQFSIINNDMQVCGFEFSTAIKGLNLRGEAARFITDDPDGIHYDILNPKWSLLLGGDVNLPLHHINVNVQYLQDIVTEDNDVTLAQYQQQMQTMIRFIGLDPSFADLNLNHYWVNHLVSLRVGDSFFRDSFKPEIQFVHRFESNDDMLTLKADYAVNDQLHLIGFWRQFSGDANTVFGQYDQNDFMSLRGEYHF